MHLFRALVISNASTTLAFNLFIYFSVNLNSLFLISNKKPRCVISCTGVVWDLDGWHVKPNNYNNSNTADTNSTAASCVFNKASISSKNTVINACIILSMFYHNLMCFILLPNKCGFLITATTGLINFENAIGLNDHPNGKPLHW